MNRIWTPSLTRRLRHLYPKLGPVETAARLGVTECAVKSRANRIGITTGRRYWTEADSAIVRQTHLTHIAAQVAAMLGRTQKAVEQHRKSLGLRKLPDYDSLLPKIQELHGKGLTDAAIAREMAKLFNTGNPRRAVTGLRERLGLPVNAVAVLASRRAAAKTQLQRMGLKSHAELRSLSFRRFARENGWSEDLPPRGVQVLNVLAEHGPKTRQELVAALGLKWKSTNCGRNNLVHRSRGSILADLQARGLVLRKRRYTTGKPHGKNQLPSVYLLTLKAITERETNVGLQHTAEAADQRLLAHEGPRADAGSHRARRVGGKDEVRSDRHHR